MLNMDFTQAVLIDTNKLDWVASPMSGVFRKPLAREGAERGHATSLVQYEAGSVFRPHPHPLGEEILVLSGVFSDQQGDFEAGSYFRVLPLYMFGMERVWLVRIQNGDNLLSELDLASSVELFVISGQASYGELPLSSGMWLREPQFLSNQWNVESSCFIWLKSGHF